MLSPQKNKEDTDINLFIGKRIRQQRRALGLTQKDLGCLVGVAFQQIQKYECGANRISAAMIPRLAVALSVDVGYFYPSCTLAAQFMPASQEVGELQQLLKHHNEMSDAARKTLLAAASKLVQENCRSK